MHVQIQFRINYEQIFLKNVYKISKPLGHISLMRLNTGKFPIMIKMSRKMSFFETPVKSPRLTRNNLPKKTSRKVILTQKSNSSQLNIQYIKHMQRSW